MGHRLPWDGTIDSLRLPHIIVTAKLTSAIPHLGCSCNLDVGSNCFQTGLLQTNTIGFICDDYGNDDAGDEPGGACAEDSSAWNRRRSRATDCPGPARWRRWCSNGSDRQRVVGPANCRVFRLPLPILGESPAPLKAEQLVVYKAASSVNDYDYELTPSGFRAGLAAVSTLRLPRAGPGAFRRIRRQRGGSIAVAYAPDDGHCVGPWRGC